MANVSYKLKDLEKKKTIKIGYVGENNHMHVRIDCEEVFKEYPNAAVTMAITPPEGEDYPKVVTRDGNVVEWTVANSDVAAEGYGEFQMTFTEGEVIRKTVTASFEVIRSIVGNGTAPSGIDDFLTDANAKLAEVDEAIQDAEDAASHAPTIGNDGYWYRWDADQGEYVSTGTKAQGEQGDPGSPGDPTQLIDDTAGEGQTGKTWSANKLDEEFGGVLNSIHGLDDTTEELDDAVFTTGQEVITAPDLFLTVTDTDLMLSIDETSFSESQNQSGFYVDVSAYRGKELLIKRTENGNVLRGVFTHDIPAVGTTFSSENTWSKGTKTGRCIIVDVPNDNTINYVYIAYHSTSGDTITKQQALAGMTIFQPDATNYYTKASDDMTLGFSNGNFNSSQVLYGFCVPIDDATVGNILIQRTNTGTRFRAAFSADVPAVGVAYSGYTDSSYDTKNQIYVSVPSGAKYLYVAYWRSSDSPTKEQTLAGMEIRFCVPAEITVDTGKQSRIALLNDEVYDKGTENLFDVRSDSMLLGLDAAKFVSSDQLHGFYVPIDPDKGTTVTIRRSNAGQRFRIVSCADIPAVNVTYTSGKRIAPDTSKVAVYDKIEPTDKYLYIAYYNPNYDTLTEAELLAGFKIIYGSEHDYVAEESRIDRLDYLKSVGFTNGNINSSGKVVDDSKHIVSTDIRVNGRYGISADDDYTVTVHEFDYDGKHINSYDVTNAVKYSYHWGIIRVCVSDNSNIDITPASVDFSSIKIPCNRFSAKGYADNDSFVLDAENCLCNDVYAYIDSVADTHGMYATKTFLCTETSGISTYYYTLGSGAKKLCILSGQHGPGNGGDPRDSVITVAKMVHDLIDGNFAHGSFLQKLHDEYTILVIPILNAYGFNNFSRTDANDVDTNRDWVDAETIEVGAAKPIIAAFDPDIAFDVHCNGTTPVSNVDVEIQFYLGSYNNPYKGAVEDYFKSYYNMNVATREANSTETFSYYIVNTLQAYGGLLELRWWLKNKKWMHDYQVESGNYAMLVNVIKYFDAVSESETFEWEKTPNQNQY